jgi:hypothetical protein
VFEPAANQGQALLQASAQIEAVILRWHQPGRYAQRLGERLTGGALYARKLVLQVGQGRQPPLQAVRHHLRQHA